MGHATPHRPDLARRSETAGTGKARPAGQQARRVRDVAEEAPWLWLAAGWADFRRARRVSLLYGLTFVVVGWALTAGLALADMHYMISPLISGFLLVGPALSLGFYEISRKLEQGETPTLGDAFTAWRRNPAHIFTAGLILVLMLMVWVRIEAVIFAITFPYVRLTPDNLLAQLLTVEGAGFMVAAGAFGAFVATLIFVLGAVSLPAMLERRIDIFSAAALSFRVVMRNLPAMALWAVLIVALTGIGMVPAFLGLALTLPLIGHASWHAYRATVEHPGNDV